jgi:hypothetical protein
MFQCVSIKVLVPGRTIYKGLSLKFRHFEKKTVNPFSGVVEISDYRAVTKTLVPMTNALPRVFVLLFSFHIW